MCNTDIRQEAKAANVRLWRIADRLGLADHVFSRRLRHELPEADKAQIRMIIKDLSEDKDAGQDNQS